MCWAPNFQISILRDKSLKEAMTVKWGCKSRSPNPLTWHHLIRRKTLGLSASFHVGNGGKAKFPATCDAREEVVPGGTSGLAFWPPEPWAKNACCVSHPTCGWCANADCVSTPAMGRKKPLAAGTKVPGSGVNIRVQDGPGSHENTLRGLWNTKLVPNADQCGQHEEAVHSHQCLPNRLMDPIHAHQTARCLFLF